jgi:hypothetical protein
VRRRVDVGAAGDVLLEHVVLDRAGELVAADALLLRHQGVEQQQHGAGALMVIDVDTLSSGISSNSSRMSSSESIATPTLPTSPEAIGSSES